MPLQVTREELREAVRKQADLRGLTHISDAEIDTILQDWVDKYYDLRQTHGPPGALSKDFPLTTTTAQRDYNLAELCPDFAYLTDVYAVEGSSGESRLRPVVPMDRGRMVRYVPVRGAFSVIVRYVPHPPRLTRDDGAGGSIDGSYGAKRYIVKGTTMDLLQAEESSTYEMRQDLAKEEQRIISAVSSIDLKGINYFTDVDEMLTTGFPFSQQVDAYGFRGPATLELYSGAITWPV